MAKVHLFLIIGIYYYKNESKFEGEWENGIKVGKGTYYLENGDKYEGEWKNNESINKGNFIINKYRNLHLQGW